MTQCPQPTCGSLDSSVIDSRSVNQAVRRRRKCRACGHRWSTYEVSAEAYAVMTGFKPGALDTAARAVCAAAVAMTSLRDQAALYQDGRQSDAAGHPTVD